MRRTVLCLTIGMILSAPTPAAEGARSRSSRMEGAQAAANELGVYCCPSPAFVTVELLVTFEPNTSLTREESDR